MAFFSTSTEILYRISLCHCVRSLYLRYAEGKHQCHLLEKITILLNIMSISFTGKDPLLHNTALTLCDEGVGLVAVIAPNIGLTFCLRFQI